MSKIANQPAHADTDTTGHKPSTLRDGLIKYRDQLKLLWKTSRIPIEVLWCAEEIEKTQDRLDALKEVK